MLIEIHWFMFCFVHVWEICVKRIAHLDANIPSLFVSTSTGKQVCFKYCRQSSFHSLIEDTQWMGTSLKWPMKRRSYDLPEGNQSSSKKNCGEKYFKLKRCVVFQNQPIISEAWISCKSCIQTESVRERQSKTAIEAKGRNREAEKAPVEPAFK